LKIGLAPGDAATRTLVVDEQRCIGFMGPDNMVYATPRMASDMESLCRDMLLARLAPGEDSVGTHIAIDHIAATPLGMTVSIEVRVLEVGERSVTFEVSAADSLEPCGRAKHVRFVVDSEKRKQRLAAKRARAAAGGTTTRTTLETGK
jgi:fluoroacetyl-CoA thioesterase